MKFQVIYLSVICAAVDYEASKQIYEIATNVEPFSAQVTTSTLPCITQITNAFIPKKTASGQKTNFYNLSAVSNSPGFIYRTTIWSNLSVYVTNAILITPQSTVRYLRENSALTNTIKELLTSGEVCKVRGEHVWLIKPVTTLEYCPYDSPTKQKCILCGTNQTGVEEWK